MSGHPEGGHKRGALGLGGDVPTNQTPVTRQRNTSAYAQPMAGTPRWVRAQLQSIERRALSRGRSHGTRCSRCQCRGNATPPLTPSPWPERRAGCTPKCSRSNVGLCPEDAATERGASVLRPGQIHLPKQHRARRCPPGRRQSAETPPLPHRCSRPNVQAVPKTATNAVHRASAAISQRAGASKAATKPLRLHSSPWPGCCAGCSPGCS